MMQNPKSSKKISVQVDSSVVKFPWVPRLESILLVVWSAVLISGVLVAAPSRSGAADFFTGRYSLDGYLGAQVQRPTKGFLFNPGNRILFIPDEFAFAELRPNARVSLGDHLQLVARPRARGVWRSQPDLEPDGISDATLRDLYVNEGFATLRATDDIEFTIGRQNFQWGPAESFSPSNILFPELLFRIEPYYEVRGRYMARANVAFGDSWSWITLGELNPVDDDDFETPPVVNEFNQQRVETKLEFRWDNGGKYVGLIAGRRDVKGPQAIGGGYAAWTISDAWQVYADGIVQEGSELVYPVSSTALSSDTLDEAAYLVGVLGARYTFTDGTEFRLEGIRNELGFSHDENENLRAGLSNPSTRLPFLAIANQAQMVLPAQSFVYSALRLSSPGVWFDLLRQPTVGLRSLYCIDDNSSFSFATLEAGLSDMATLYLFAGVSSGEAGASLRRWLDHVAGVTYRLSM